jgi:hypothetical protein
MNTLRHIPIGGRDDESYNYLDSGRGCSVQNGGQRPDYRALLDGPLAFDAAVSLEERVWPVLFFVPQFTSF